MYMTFFVLFLVFSCFFLYLFVVSENIAIFAAKQCIKLSSVRFARHTRKETDTLLLFFVFLEIICEKVV